MDNVVINELNAVLKGEYMAVDSYDKFIDETQDETVKNELEGMKQDHESHVKELSRHIAAIGGVPCKSSEMASIITETMSVIHKIKKRDTAEILKNVYDGEDKGIAKVEKIIKGDLDRESDMLVKQLLSEDHDHLKNISRMILEYEVQ